MAIKLLLAKPEGDGEIKDQAQLHFLLWDETEASAVHKLKLRRDPDGDWHPELSLGVEVCWGKTLETCLGNIHKVLSLLLQTIDEDGPKIPKLAEWLGPPPEKEKKKQ